jgi:hypothetical protein
MYIFQIDIFACMPGYLFVHQTGKKADAARTLILELFGEKPGKIRCTGVRPR